MSEIFNKHEECEEPRVVLIEGKPGMGKTTYCKKVAVDWATGKHNRKLLHKLRNSSFDQMS